MIGINGSIIYSYQTQPQVCVSTCSEQKAPRTFYVDGVINPQSLTGEPATPALYAVQMQIVARRLPVLRTHLNACMSALS